MAKKTKKEELDEAVAKAVGAGREMHLETVDFSDPNRPKTCIECDYPIIPVNAISTLEASSGASTKPIYQISKWWARRQSSVFRSILLAAATRCPPNSADSAKVIWDAYYGRHDLNPQIGRLKVADVFMGGGTTLVEGTRLGMKMIGNDLNPVAWFVVKAELASTQPSEIESFLNEVESRVRPQVIPLFAVQCPRGHHGTWKHCTKGEVTDPDFSPTKASLEERLKYSYSGPEIIFTFWAKHGPCLGGDCGHRTPIMTDPIVVQRTLTVKAWCGWTCTSCGQQFDIEQKDARLAPKAYFVAGASEEPYAVLDQFGHFACPHCQKAYQDDVAVSRTTTVRLGKAKTKHIELTVVVHPKWLRGCGAKNGDGELLGGAASDDVSSTRLWHSERALDASLIEIRGELPTTISCPITGQPLAVQNGTVSRKSTFVCQNPTCGRENDVLDAIKASGKSGPMAAYAVMGYCPTCDAEGHPSGGRFIEAASDTSLLLAAFYEWDQRRHGDLHPYWPRCELSYGWKTHGWAIPDHGYTHYWKMFNSRQLLVHSTLLKEIVAVGKQSGNQAAMESVLAAFQQYLRYNSGFTIWHRQNNQISAFLSNNSYQAKNTIVETGVYSPVGDGSWSSACRGLRHALEWKADPWELVPNTFASSLLSANVAAGLSGQTTKVYPGDSPSEPSVLLCQSSSELGGIEDGSIDLVVTDPPFGEIMQYAELSDYFYVWLKLVLDSVYPSVFSQEYTPKALEAVANPVRNVDPDAFYQQILTACWKEAIRILKPGGLLIFTFHHQKDEPWVAVLESLFDAGAYLEATYPVRSDISKGEEKVAFGAEKVEYDIIHVCRKRVEESQEISWARMRRQIMQDVKQLRDILEQHQLAGLQEADLQVIRRGKALEYYSKHYGKVYVEKGRPFSVREALVGINTLLDDERDTNKETPPVNAEPYTRQFLRLFADKTAIPRDQMQKFLRGTGVSPAEFTERGWCSETQKVFHVTPPLELAREWKGAARSGMARDFDQSMFLIGACYSNSGIRVQDTLDSPNFKPHPATPGILDWLTRHGGDSEIKTAARLAKQLYERWMAANESKVTVQRTLFDELGD